jgi:hypothetical protein
VRHESIVAFVGLDDRRSFEIVFVETVDDGVYFSELVVESADVDVTALDTVAVGVQGVGRVVFVIGENAKVLRPISQRRGCVDKAVWTGDVVGHG